MDLSKVLEKIKKCLALSKSSNEHEAAAALPVPRASGDEPLAYIDAFTAMDCSPRQRG